jgi:4-hydroxy-2-oxoheptanedioate aldolase
MDSLKKRDRLRALLAKGHRGERPLGLYMTIGSPALLEVAAASGVEWAMISCEHTEIGDRSLLLSLLRAADACEMVTFVKLDRWEPALAEAAMDCGAYGVGVPMMETADQLRGAIRALRFRPHGVRGFCSVSRAFNWSAEYATGDFTDYHGYWDFQREAPIVPFIETRKAMANLDEILGVEGVPMVVVGGADLALDLSEDGRPAYAKLPAAEAEIARKVRAHKALFAHWHHPVLTNMPGAEPASMDPTLAADRLRDKDITMPFVIDAFILAQGMHDARVVRDKLVKK